MKSNELYIENLRDSIDCLLNKDPLIYLIGEDIADPYGGAFKVTKGLSTKYPGRLISTPMSEQGFTGIGIGMALNGLKPIIEIMFGDFITLTADQIINHISKFYDMYDKNVNFVLRTPSGGYRGYGATHSQSLEKIYFGIPGIKVVSPSILHPPGKLLQHSIDLGMPVIFIENKLDYGRKLIDNTVLKDFIKIESLDDTAFPIKKVSIIDEPSDISIISYGGMTQLIVDVIEYLFIEEEIAVELFSISDLTHTNFEGIAEKIHCNTVITIEESYSEFGWGSHVISKVLKRKKNVNFDILGAKMAFIPASQRLEEEMLLQKEDIIRKIKALLGV